VNAAKYDRIQFFLKLSHAAAKEVALRPDMKASVVVSGFDPIDFGRLQEHNLPRALDGNALD